MTEQSTAFITEWLLLTRGIIFKLVEPSALNNYGRNGGGDNVKGLRLKRGPFPAHFQLLARDSDGKTANMKNILPCARQANQQQRQ